MTTRKVIDGILMELTHTWPGGQQTWEFINQRDVEYRGTAPAVINNSGRDYNVSIPFSGAITRQL